MCKGLQLNVSRLCCINPTSSGGGLRATVCCWGPVTELILKPEPLIEKKKMWQLKAPLWQWQMHAVNIWHLPPSHHRSALLKGITGKLYSKNNEKKNQFSFWSQPFHHKISILTTTGNHDHTGKTAHCSKVNLHCCSCSSRCRAQNPQHFHQKTLFK